MKRLLLFLFLSALFGASPATLACDDCKTTRIPTGVRVVEYDLHIREQTVHPAGKAVRGFTINNPKNGNEVAWIISQLSAVVQNAGANGVFFNSPTG